MSRRDRWLETEPGWSKNPFKRRRLEQEPYLQEAWTELVGLSQGTLDTVENKSFIVFKPDAAPARCVDTCMAVLAENGIRPVASRLFTFDRLAVRELWRYELNISTYARYPAIDALLTRAPSLFVLLECDPGAKEEGLAACLESLKGPSQADLREPHHLRARIRAGDGVLNHIHTPSETIDVLREIAVLFDRRARRSLLESLVRESNPPVAIDADRASFLAAAEPHALSVPEIRRRFLGQRDDLDFDRLLRLAATLDDFEAFEQRLDELGLRASWWDAMTLFVAERPLAVEGVVPVLDYELAMGDGAVDR